MPTPWVLLQAKAGDGALVRQHRAWKKFCNPIATSFAQEELSFTTESGYTYYFHFYLKGMGGAAGTEPQSSLYHTGDTAAFVGMSHNSSPNVIAGATELSGGANIFSLFGVALPVACGRVGGSTVTSNPLNYAVHTWRGCLIVGANGGRFGWQGGSNSDATSNLMHSNEDGMLYYQGFPP